MDDLGTRYLFGGEDSEWGSDDDYFDDDFEDDDEDDFDEDDDLEEEFDWES